MPRFNTSYSGDWWEWLMGLEDDEFDSIVGMVNHFGAGLINGILWAADLERNRVAHKKFADENSEEKGDEDE